MESSRVVGSLGCSSAKVNCEEWDLIETQGSDKFSPNSGTFCRTLTPHCRPLLSPASCPTSCSSACPTSCSTSCQSSCLLFCLLSCFCPAPVLLLSCSFPAPVLLLSCSCPASCILLYSPVLLLSAPVCSYPGPAPGCHSPGEPSASQDLLQRPVCRLQWSVSQ